MKRLIAIVYTLLAVTQLCSAARYTENTYFGSNYTKIYYGSTYGNGVLATSGLFTPINKLEFGKVTIELDAAKKASYGRVDAYITSPANNTLTVTIPDVENAYIRRVTFFAPPKRNIIPELITLNTKGLC